MTTHNKGGRPYADRSIVNPVIEEFFETKGRTWVAAKIYQLGGPKLKSKTISNYAYELNITSLKPIRWIRAADDATRKYWPDVNKIHEIYLSLGMDSFPELPEFRAEDLGIIPPEPRKEPKRKRNIRQEPCNKDAAALLRMKW